MPGRGQPPTPLPGLVDAHAHVAWSQEFEGEHPAILQRAWDAGLIGIVDVGVDLASSLACRALAAREPRIRAVAGLHPHEARHLERDRAGLETAVREGGFAAIGEIGLDFHYNHSTPAEQERALRWQLELARECNLPVVIHSRAADEQCFDILTAWSRHVGRYLGDRPVGMMHCFSGNADLAVRYLDAGFLISVPGTVTFDKNHVGQEVARALPLAGMLVETDCPYLTPAPHRGLRNEPAYVVETARFVASLRGCSAEEVAQATAANAARLFGTTWL